jgi:hypothetical protein
VPAIDAPLTEADIAAEIEAAGDDGRGLVVLEMAVDLGHLAEAAHAQGVKLAERNVFDERGVARVAIIRPCMSRGKAIRNLRPIYTPQMLEADAGVFTGWPMYFDHTSKRLREMLEEAGRSVREMAGQILRAWWDPTFTHPDDAKYGYRTGGVLAEVWGTPFIREMVGNNPNLLHTSINAWPKSGKPGTAPWAPSGPKGMVIEGIRAEPQGSVDFVPRGGAGGRLLAEDEQLVVSAADRVYNSERQMPETKKTPDFAKMTPPQLREWAEEHAPHLAEAIAVEGNAADAATKPKAKAEAQAAGLSEAEVKRLIDTAREGDADAEKTAREAADAAVKEAREQEALASKARQLIEAADGLTPGFKASLLERYAVLPSGPMPALLVEEDDAGKDGAHRDKPAVLESAVKADIDHALNLIAEAKGKPRVTGEGGAKPENGGDGKAKSVQERREDGKTPFWRQSFADMGIVESADDALAIHGLEYVEEK